MAIVIAFHPDICAIMCDGGCTKDITITADLAYYMTVTADKSTLNIGDTANLQVRFFDINGAEIVIPNVTSPHSFVWSSDEAYAAVPIVPSSGPGKKECCYWSIRLLK